MPDVSVLMPVYNLSNYPDGWFERAVESIFLQRAKVQLCIVDDCSTDKTLDKLYIWGADKYIKVAKTEKNTGGCDAVNLAASMATGKYFILLSCRSWYEPESLSKMARYLDEHPDIGFVYGNTQFHDDKRFGGDWLKTPPPFKADDFKKLFMSSFGYMYRREAWDAGMRYGCVVYHEEEDRYSTIADYHMVMNLIFKMKYTGYHMNLTTLHYQFGGKQMNDFLVKYRPQIKAEFKRLWPQSA